MGVGAGAQQAVGVGLASGIDGVSFFPSGKSLDLNQGVAGAMMNSAPEKRVPQGNPPWRDVSQDLVTGVDDLCNFDTRVFASAIHSDVGSVLPSALTAPSPPASPSPHSSPLHNQHVFGPNGEDWGEGAVGGGGAFASVGIDTDLDRARPTFSSKSTSTMLFGNLDLIEFKDAANAIHEYAGPVSSSFRTALGHLSFRFKVDMARFSDIHDIRSCQIFVNDALAENPDPTPESLQMFEIDRIKGEQQLQGIAQHLVDSFSTQSSPQNHAAGDFPDNVGTIGGDSPLLTLPLQDIGSAQCGGGAGVFLPSIPVSQNLDPSTIVSAVVAEFRTIMRTENLKFSKELETQKDGFCRTVAEQALSIQKLTKELQQVRSEVIPFLAASPPGSPRSAHRQQVEDAQRTQQQQQQQKQQFEKKQRMAAQKKEQELKDAMEEQWRQNAAKEKREKELAAAAVARQQEENRLAQLKAEADRLQTAAVEFKRQREAIVLKEEAVLEQFRQLQINNDRTKAAQQKGHQQQSHNPAGVSFQGASAQVGPIAGAGQTAVHESAKSRHQRKTTQQLEKVIAAVDASRVTSQQQHPVGGERPDGHYDVYTQRFVSPENAGTAFVDADGASILGGTSGNQGVSGLVSGGSHATHRNSSDGPSGTGGGGNTSPPSDGVPSFPSGSSHVPMGTGDNGEHPPHPPPIQNAPPPGYNQRGEPNNPGNNGGGNGTDRRNQTPQADVDFRTLFEHFSSTTNKDFKSLPSLDNKLTLPKFAGHKSVTIQECTDFLDRIRVVSAALKWEERLPALFFGNISTAFTTSDGKRTEAWTWFEENKESLVNPVNQRVDFKRFKILFLERFIGSWYGTALKSAWEARTLAYNQSLRDYALQMKDFANYYVVPTPSPQQIQQQILAHLPRLYQVELYVQAKLAPESSVSFEDFLSKIVVRAEANDYSNFLSGAPASAGTRLAEKPTTARVVPGLNPKTFFCIHHPGATAHNTQDCRVEREKRGELRRQTEQRQGNPQRFLNVHDGAWEDDRETGEDYVGEECANNVSSISDHDEEGEDDEGVPPQVPVHAAAAERPSDVRRTTAGRGAQARPEEQAPRGVSGPGPDRQGREGESSRQFNRLPMYDDGRDPGNRYKSNLREIDPKDLEYPCSRCENPNHNHLDCFRNPN